jgi:succinate-semialdehyde dehydrogenase/glutarate-semialdehyde dehydrogenase
LLSTHNFGSLTESGIGREGGKESLDAYMITKTVLQRIAPV